MLPERDGEGLLVPIDVGCVTDGEAAAGGSAVTCVCDGGRGCAGWCGLSALSVSARFCGTAKVIQDITTETRIDGKSTHRFCRVVGLKIVTCVMA
jgi:hypothetical protein